MAVLVCEWMNNIGKAKVWASEHIALNCVQTLSGIAPGKNETDLLLFVES